MVLSKKSLAGKNNPWFYLFLELLRRLVWVVFKPLFVVTM